MIVAPTHSATYERNQMNLVHPQCAANVTLRAAASRSETVAVFAESSSAMFYATHALRELGDARAPYCQMSSHWGSMGHAIGGAIGFCTATGQRAIVLTGDGSFHLMNPLPVAVKHGCAITMVVLNDSRLSLPYFGSGRIGAHGAQATTSLAEWDFTRQGSSHIGGRRVRDLAHLDDALEAALTFDGCFVVDVAIDPSVTPPVGGRFDSVDELFGGQGS